MKELVRLDDLNYDPALPRFTRAAIRAVIIRDGKLAMIHSEKYGDYKFPGGGAEGNETHAETLIREVREETGLTVIPASIREHGRAIETRKGMNEGEIFEQVSYYYFCDAEEGIRATNLDDYERDYRYSLEFITPQEAYARNSALPSMEQTPWVRRETLVLQGLFDAVKKQS